MWNFLLAKINEPKGIAFQSTQNVVMCFINMVSAERVPFNNNLQK